MARSSNPVWNRYEHLLLSLSERLAADFEHGIKQAIQTSDQIAIDGYHAWRLANHPSIRNRALSPLRRRYAVADSKHFVTAFMDTVKVDDQYIRRFRYMLQSVYEQLDELIASGEWVLPDDPTRAQIEAKIMELGGSENPVPTIHRTWQRQRSKSVRGKAAERDEEERQRLGFATVEELHAFRGAQRDSARRDEQRVAWRHFQQETGEIGQRIEQCPGAGSGLYLETDSGLLFKLSQEERDAVVSYLNLRRRNNRNARRGTQPVTTRDQQTAR